MTTEVDHKKAEGTPIFVCPTCHKAETRQPDRVMVSFMTDGCTFKHAPKLMPEAILEWVVQGVINDVGFIPEPVTWFRYGLLCPVCVYVGELKVREVGPRIHTRGAKPEQIEKLRSDGAKWIAALYSDPDIPRLMHAAMVESRS